SRASNPFPRPPPRSGEGEKTKLCIYIRRHEVGKEVGLRNRDEAIVNRFAAGDCAERGCPFVETGRVVERNEVAGLTGFYTRDRVGLIRLYSQSGRTTGNHRLPFAQCEIGLNVVDSQSARQRECRRGGPSQLLDDRLGLREIAALRLVISLGVVSQRVVAG